MSLPVRQSWFGALAARLSSWRRAPTATPDTPHVAGADFAAEVAAAPGYPQLQAMSALGAFALVYACANTVAAALASRPRMVLRGRGKSAGPVENHPFLSVIARPSERVGAALWHRQRVVDHLLAGTAYTRVLQDPALRGRPSLLRLHPARCEIRPRPNGDPDGVDYDHGMFVPWADVLMVRGPSWEDTPAGAYGLGWVSVLHEELQTELAAIRGAQGMARRGAPAWVVMPESDKDGRAREWTDEQTKKVKAMLELMLSHRNSGGALTFGHRVDAKPLGFSAVDMQFVEGRKVVAERILAVARVPPSKVGIRGANYATARAEDVNFWEARVEEAALFDDEDSRLAERLGRPGDRVVTDFTGVDALQHNRSARQARVRLWVDLGVPIAKALAAEGFDDVEAPVATTKAAPVEDPTIGRDDPAPDPPDAKPPGNDDQAGQGRGWWRSEDDPRFELARRVKEDLYAQAVAETPAVWVHHPGCAVPGHLERDGSPVDEVPDDTGACGCVYVPDPDPHPGAPAWN